MPIHIAGKILGHNRLVTTQGYTAVLNYDLIRSYLAFLDARPGEEYREPTDAEWASSSSTFRPASSNSATAAVPTRHPAITNKPASAAPCCASAHEPDPDSTRSLRTLCDRVDEARADGWLGEIQSLQIWVDAAAGKLASLDRATRRQVPLQFGLADGLARGATKVGNG